MKNVLIILIAIILFSCDDYEKQIIVCNCQQQEKVRISIENSIKNTNNYSDEEMEDVIAQLEKTYIKTVCSRTRGIFSSNHNFDWKSVKQDSCLVYYPYLY